MRTLAAGQQWGDREVVQEKMNRKLESRGTGLRAFHPLFHWVAAETGLRTCSSSTFRIFDF